MISSIEKKLPSYIQNVSSQKHNTYPDATEGRQDLQPSSYLKITENKYGQTF